jgi:hypothetical protein
MAIVLWQDHLIDGDGMMPAGGQPPDHDFALCRPRTASR